jgi:hypothetical protein
MFQVSRNIISVKGSSSSLYLTLSQRRRPQTFGLRDRWRSGIRTWMYCTSSLFPSNVMAKTSFQSCTTVITTHTLSLCEAVCTSRHPYRDPRDADTPSLSKWLVFFENSLSFNQLNISRVDIPCVLQNDVGEAARPTQPVTLYITVSITAPNLYNSPPSIPTEDDDSPAEEATIPGRIRLSAPEHLLPLSNRQPAETGNTIPQSREEMSSTSTKNPRSALDWADKTMKRIVPIDRLNTWERAVGRIKWVMDTLSPIAEVRVMPF